MSNSVKLKQPGSLGVEGQQMWDHLTENIPSGILHPVDAFALFGLCSWWEVWLFWVQDTNDPHPYRAYRATCMAGAAYKHFFNAAKEFGLTPKSRKELNYDPADHGADPFSLYMKERLRNNQYPT